MVAPPGAGDGLVVVVVVAGAEDLVVALELGLVRPLVAPVVLVVRVGSAVWE